MTEIEQRWLDEPRLSADESDSYPLSPSAIKTFTKCPEQWRLKYRTDLDATKAGKGYAGLGIAVHESIEEVLKSDAEYSESVLNHELRQEYNRRADDVRDDMYGDGLDYLEVAARYIAAKQPSLRGVEMDSEFGLSRPDVNIRFRGIVDVATMSEVWDWKTGRIRDDTPLEEKIQGAVYMRAFQEQYGQPPEQIRFVYLKEESERILDPSDEVWDTMIERAKALLQAQDSDNFPADPAPSKCFFCGMEFHCDSSPVGLGGIEWNQI